MKKATLLWVDLEMTGLAPKKDRIMEVAAIATDWDFNEVSRFTAVIKVPTHIIKTRMVGDFWEKNKESYNSLVTQNKSGKPRKIVEAELIKFLDDNFVSSNPKNNKKSENKSEIYLAGNSIHQDRRFIRNEWPTLDSRLHYRMLDVSSWKVYFEHAMNIKFAKRDAHRALDDIEGSIAELKLYLSKVKGSKFESK